MIYYVRTDGSNTNSGTGYTTSEAFLTVAKAITVVAAGDTVYIAPGTYYETMTLATAGTFGEIISWRGDREAQYFIDLKPNYVRITACNSSTGIPTTASILNCNTKGYNDFYSLVFDGTSGNNNGIINPTTITRFYDCMIFSDQIGILASVAANCLLYRCFVAGGACGIRNCTSYNCIAIGAGGASSSGGFYVGAAYNCISMASAYYGFNSVPTCYNCTAYGSVYSFYNCLKTVNCTAVFGFAGFAGTGTQKYTKCKAITCSYAAYGTSLTSPLNISDIRHTHCNSVQRGSTYETGTPTEIAYEGYTDVSRILKIATAFKQDLFSQDWSSDLHNLTVSGNILAANDYVSIGTYTGQTLYQSVFKDNLIFYSTLSATTWVIQANTGSTPDETATNYAYFSSTTPIGTYINVGTWTGTTVIADYTAITFSENYDILKHPRRMGNGILDCGAYEYSTTSLDWTTYHSSAPSVKISQAGYKRISVPVKSGTTKTISCWTYFNLSGETSKPQLIITSPQDVLTTNPVILTATGSELTWEQLTTTITPKADGIMNIEMYSRTTGSTTYSLFNDFRI